MATTDMQRLVVSLEARTKAFENALKKANTTSQRQLGQIEKKFAAANKKLVLNTPAWLSRGMVSAFAGGISLRGAQDLVDTAIRIDNALKVSGLSGEALTAVYDNLFAAAQRNAAPLESLVELYSRASLSAKDLGISQAELLRFTEGVAVALRVNGKSASESSGALLQLSQLLGSGTVRAEEFNSVQEGALPILQAVAAGLKEAGGSVSELRKLVVDGKVSSEAFFRAFEAGSGILQDKVAGATLTTGQQFEKLKNELIKVAGELNKVTGASDAVGTGLERLGGVVNGLNSIFQAAAEGPIGAFIGQLNALNSVLQQVLPGINALGLLNGDTLKGIASGISGMGAAVAPNPRAELSGLYDDLAATEGSSAGGAIKERIGQIERELYGAGPSTRGKYKPAPTDIGTVTVTPVSLADYSVTGAKSGGGGGGKSKANDFEREIQQIRERTAAIQAETAAMAGLNPLVDDYGYSVEKARAKAELLTAAQKAGIAITPELEAKIDALAGAYATASSEAEKLTESQDRARETAQEFSDLGKDVLGGFIKDLRDGKSASEALANALSKVGEKLLDVALNSIFEGGSGGGILGGLFQGLFSIFGFADGGIAKNGKPLKKFARGGVSKDAAIFGEGPTAEAAVPLPDGRRIPVDLRTPNLQAAKPTNETVTVVLQDDSGRMAAIADTRIHTSAGTIVRVAVDQSTKAVKRQMPGLMANAQSRQI